MMFGGNYGIFSATFFNELYPFFRFVTGGVKAIQLFHVIIMADVVIEKCPGF
ncbi:hypothetical protein D3C71_2086870 [compost metagenome]